MEKLISRIKRYNLQVIIVTQDLRDFKDIGDDAAKAIFENCNVLITLANGKGVETLKLEGNK